MNETIDEANLEQLVNQFYMRVRADPELGPIFDSRLSGRWTPHLRKMVDFWTSALVAPGRYSGNPRAVHASVAEIEPAHFDRWLELFGQTLAELYDPATAESIHRRARMMARALINGLENKRPGLPLTEDKQVNHG